MITPPLRLISGLFAIAAGLTLSGCKSPAGGSSTDDVVDYTSPTTRMSRAEKENYAFDEGGKYREDWVARSAGATSKPSKPFVQRSDDTRPARTIASTGFSSDVVNYTSPGTSASTRRPSTSHSATGRPTLVSHPTANRPTASHSTASHSTPKPKPKPKPTYVKVAPGDTLYAISRKSGVSVDRIKAYNGLKSDLIRDGSSLKIPPKKS